MKVIVYRKNGVKTPQFNNIQHVWGTNGELTLIGEGGEEVARIRMSELISYEIW